MTEMLKLSRVQADRAAGVLLATACGDALGAGYEFGPALPAGRSVEMKGGGPFGWAPGEWTDDTAMPIPIARAAATGADLRDEAARGGTARSRATSSTGASCHQGVSRARSATRSWPRMAKPNGSLPRKAAAKAHGGQKTVIPFVQAATIMHGEGSTLTLSEAAAATTCALDGCHVTGVASIRELLDGQPQVHQNVIDQQRAKALVALIAGMGLQVRPNVRRLPASCSAHGGW